MRGRLGCHEGAAAHGGGPANLLDNGAVALGLEAIQLKRLAEQWVEGLARAVRARGKGGHGKGRHQRHASDAVLAPHRLVWWWGKGGRVRSISAWWLRASGKGWERGGKGGGARARMRARQACIPRSSVYSRSSLMRCVNEMGSLKLTGMAIFDRS